MKMIVPCVWGQLFCSVNSAARHIAGNATPGGTVDCLITSLSGCHKRHLCQDLEVRRYYKFLLSQCSKWVVIPRLSQSKIKVSMAWE